MNEMEWHLDATVLDRYRDDRLDAASTFSVEAHLVACATCASQVREHVPTARLDAVWDEIVDRLDAPARTPVERVLVGLGVRDHVARLLAGVPALTVPWVGAVATVLGFAVLSAHLRPSGLVFFLIVAPLLPLAGIATAYGPGLDPTYEIGVSAPLRGSRLLMIRAVAVLAVSTVLSFAAALALPGAGWALAAWILPSLALALLALALGTFGAPTRSAASIAFVWAVLVTGAEIVHGAGLLAFGEVGQITSAAVVLGAAALLAVRRDRVEGALGSGPPGWDL